MVVRLDPPDGDPLRVLAIGCHADDIEIGCGGTLLTLVRRNPGLEVTWAVLSAEGARRDEAELSARTFLEGATKVDLRVESLRDGFFPHRGEEVKEWFEALKADIQPTIVFTHTLADRHQDHRLVAELSWNTFRRHLILEYEIPKYDGDLGAPGVFVPLDPAVAEDKVRHILECYKSQSDRHWFSRDVFMALMRLRAMEANAGTDQAEAFYGRKLVLGVGAPGDMRRGRPER